MSERITAPMMVKGPEGRTLSKEGCNMLTIMSQVKSLTGLKSQLTDDGGVQSHMNMDKKYFNGVAHQPFIRAHKTIYSVRDEYILIIKRTNEFMN
jgi:hypothetical protein